MVEQDKVEPTAPTKPDAVKESTPEEIMTQIAAAGVSGDLAEVIKLGNKLKKHQGDIQKAEADKLKKEAEALAGVREKLAVEIWKDITPETKKKLADVKAQGYTFKLDAPDKDGVMTNYKAVNLTVPTIKTRSNGGGGGSTGALKAQTGLSRHELVEQYATDEEKDAVAQAEANATSRPDSARYSAEKPVIKRILADNPNLIKS